MAKTLELKKIVPYAISNTLGCVVVYCCDEMLLDKKTKNKNRCCSLASKSFHYFNEEVLMMCLF